MLLISQFFLLSFPINPIKSGFSKSYILATTPTDVTVKNVVLESVKQTRYNQVVATVKGDLTTLKASDFTIWSEYSTNVHPVKKLTYDKVTSTVTLTTYFEGMTDGKTYNVVLDGVTKQFVASDGVIDHLGVSPSEITVATETDIDAVYYDVNNIVVKPEQTYAGGTRTNNLDFTITTTQGYTTATGLYLYEVGNTATASLTLHSNTYDANGNEIGNVTGTATITAVAASTITDESFSIKVGDSGSNYAAVKETVVAKGDAGKSAYIRITLSNGNTSDDLSAYKLESSDLNVLILNSVTGPTDGEVDLVPVLPGSCYIIVRDAKNNVVATLPVTVKAARYAASLSLSQYSATLSNKVEDTNTNAFIDDSVSVTATVLDQYSEDMNVTSGFTYVNKTLDGVANATAIGVVSGASVTFKADAATSATSVNTAKGTYVGVVSYSTLSKTFVTTVQEPGDEVDSYQMVLDKTTVDAVITNTATADTTVNAEIVGYDGGIKRKIYTDDVTTWSLKNGNDEVTDATGTSASETIAINDINVGDRMAAKTYALTATFTSDSDDKVPSIVKTITRNFTVTDSQHTPTVILANDGKINASITQADVMTVYYYSVGDGNTCNITGIKTNDAGVTSVSSLLSGVQGGTSYMLYDVYVTTTLSNGNLVKSVVTLNHTVSKDGNW